MAVRIRLKRMGRRNRAFYRICAMDARTRRDGRAIEELGYYDPHIEEEAKKSHVNRERAEYWLSVGAKASETCLNILLKQGVKVPGYGVRNILTAEEVEEKKRMKEEKARKREEAAIRKAIIQPRNLSKKDKRAAKRAGG